MQNNDETKKWLLEGCFWLFERRKRILRNCLTFLVFYVIICVRFSNVCLEVIVDGVVSGAILPAHRAFSGNNGNARIAEYAR